MYNKATIPLLFLLLLLTANNCFGQNPDIKRTWHWYFGYGAGIDFSSGTAVADTNGQLQTNEGCASISDTSGNLLFYTDGDSVWDKQHNVMQNGYGLLGCGNLGSAAQAAIIIPHPGNSNLFYIVTNDCSENNCLSGLRYSIVDITLNGGFGDVTIKNSLLFAPGTEMLVVAKHCNKNFYWIVSHQYLNNNFMAYLVDSNGINTNPIISSIGSVYNWHFSIARISSDGYKLATAFATTSTINELFDFDNQTGYVTNLIQLQSQSGGDWGPEFSFDNSKLYYTNSGNLIYQYDISSGIDSIINNSRVTIANVSDNSTFGTIAKGPDHKLYISSSYRDSLSTINSSNVYGIGCNLNILNFSLKRLSFLGLPNFTADYFYPTNYFNCTTGMVENNASTFIVYIDFWTKKINIKGNGIDNFALYDLLGRKLISQKNAAKNYNVQIDISSVPSGIYILSLIIKNQIFNKKLILK